MYKIEIWQHRSIVEVYESDDIQNIIAWYKWYWAGTYEEYECAFCVYKNGIELSYAELWNLGFIK